MDPYDYYRWLIDYYGVADYIADEIGEESVEEYIEWLLREGLKIHELEFEKIGIDQSSLDKHIKRSGQKYLQEYWNKRDVFGWNKIAQEVSGVLSKEQQQQLSAKIFADEFPMEEINAHAVKVPEGNGYVFLLNSGLSLFIQLTTEILISQLRNIKVNNEGIIAEYKVKEETSKYFRDLIRNYINFEMFVPPRGEVIVNRGFLRSNMVCFLIEAICWFVLAHEFGHAILGHLNNEETFLISVAKTKKELSVISKNWKEEFAADLVAGNLFLKNLPKPVDRFTQLEVSTKIAAPFLFFELIRLIEKVKGVKYISHPPTKQRSEALEVAFRQFFTPSTFFLVRSFSGIFQSFEQFWEEMR